MGEQKVAFGSVTMKECRFFKRAMEWMMTLEPRRGETITVTSSTSGTVVKLEGNPLRWWHRLAGMEESERSLTDQLREHERIVTERMG